jgi:hypothetical protein
MWQKLGTVVSKKKFTPLMRVEVPICNEEGVITGRCSLTDPHEVNTAIIEQNKKQFSQAKDTPFIVGGLSNVIHPFKQSDITESILHGTLIQTHSMMMQLSMSLSEP